MDIVIICICNPNTWKIKAVGSEVPGFPWLHKKFEAYLKYIRHVREGGMEGGKEASKQASILGVIEW